MFTKFLTVLLIIFIFFIVFMIIFFYVCFFFVLFHFIQAVIKLVNLWHCCTFYVAFAFLLVIMGPSLAFFLNVRHFCCFWKVIGSGCCWVWKPTNIFWIVAAVYHLFHFYFININFDLLFCVFYGFCGRYYLELLSSHNFICFLLVHFI